MDKPQMVEILDVAFDTSEHRTFTLDIEVDARPGQFCMLWLPCINEKPMSLSATEGKVQVTVKKLGQFTTRMFMMDAGDKIGFRGPYGKGFELVAGDVCLVGGGCGIAPLRPLAKKLKGDALISAKNAGSLLFADHFASQGFAVHQATDDGSAGEKAFAHELFGKLVEDSDYSCVYCCGPEPMMEAVHNICQSRGLESQLSLERYMKCGIGICGSCSLSGLRVCKEGPVFSGKELSATEFGSYSRDATGSRRRCDGCA